MYAYCVILFSRGVIAGELECLSFRHEIGVEYFQSAVHIITAVCCWYQ